MATKSNKKSAKKAVAAKKTTRGNTYEITAAGRKHLLEGDNAIGGQGKTVAEGLSKHGPITVNDLATKLDGKFPETKQDAKRITAFYLGQWKKDGFVKFGPKPAKAEKAAA